VQQLVEADDDEVEVENVEVVELVELLLSVIQLTEVIE
jgi:hypothetical protein